MSKDRHEVFSVMIEQWNKEVQDGVIETFVAQFQLRSFPTEPPAA